jgi:heme exporter protein C
LIKRLIPAVAVGALMIFGGYAALFIAPDESTMHAIQRIFYFHAPSGMVALMAFTICFIANIGYLVGRKPHWDCLAVAAAEVGVAFNTVVLITGPIWAKPAWGIWWAWDARLTSTLVLSCYCAISLPIQTGVLCSRRFMASFFFSTSHWFIFRFVSGEPNTRSQ